MPGPRKLRSADDLSGAAKHVAYEIAMLEHAAKNVTGMYSSPASYPDGMDMNMALESFLLHFRNLRAFLLPTKHLTKDEDIVGSDFLEHEEAKNYGDETKLMEDRARLDQMLTHLSYHRETHIDEDRDRWYVWDMFDLMKAELRDYLSLLPSERQAWIVSALPDTALRDHLSSDSLQAQHVYSTNIPKPQRLEE